VSCRVLCVCMMMSPLLSPALTSLPSPQFYGSVPFLTVDSMFSLPSLDADTTDYGSPASSTTDYVLTPDLTPSTIIEDSWCAASPSLNGGLCNQSKPFLSTYSSLTGWAGDSLVDEQRYMAIASPQCLELVAHDGFQLYSNTVDERSPSVPPLLQANWEPIYQHTENMMNPECAIRA